jgi:hypothetical protein
MQLPFTLEPDSLLGGISRENAEAPIYDARWYNAGAVGDGLAYQFPVGALASARCLTADMLLDGDDAGVFVLELQEGDHGPTFGFVFTLLPQASARLRLPLQAVQHNHWLYEREGAFVKPHVTGQRVDLRRVDRMRLMIHKRGDSVTRWCMTPVFATADESLPLAQPLLPKGPLLDELGQSTLRDWPGKSHSADEVVQRLNAQLRDAPSHRWPDDLSKWGGWTAKTYAATGFFHSHWDAAVGCWWLIDPDGCVFWSAGQNGVYPGVEANVSGLENTLEWLPGLADGEFITAVRRENRAVYVDYLQTNLMRAFGPNAWHNNWAELTLAELRRVGFNTIGSESDWATASEAGFPYARLLTMPPGASAPLIFRDLPDVFDPAFEQDAALFAEQLIETRDDPALVGYFLMSEPAWAYAPLAPAAGILYNTTTCASRLALADFLRERYGDNPHLAQAWGDGVTFDHIADSRWNRALTDAAQNDLADFSAVLLERYFSVLSAACKQVDPNHMNLGVRYPFVPPEWALSAMRSFDVFSMNCYEARVPQNALQHIHNTLNMPTLISAWHIGAMDAGLPASGNGPRVRDQTARGAAYRVYLEAAAALPWCVGVHHNGHYDQPALGRWDGEAYNTGFNDVCGRPYEELVQAARQAHRRMYAIALGEQQPFNDAPEYLSRYSF